MKPDYRINRHWRDTDHVHIEVLFDGDDLNVGAVTVSIAHIDFEPDSDEAARLHQLITLARKRRDEIAAVTDIGDKQ